MFDAEAAVNAALARKTDFERAEEARFQSEQRANLRLPTTLEIKVEMGRRICDSVSQQLREQESEELYTRLAEGFALQGNFEQALTVTRDPQMRNEYQAILNALDGKGQCACPATYNKMPTRFLKEKIFARGRQTNLFACSLCGHISC